MPRGVLGDGRGPENSPGSLVYIPIQNSAGGYTEIIPETGPATAIDDSLKIWVAHRRGFDYMGTRIQPQMWMTHPWDDQDPTTLSVDNNPGSGSTQFNGYKCDFSPDGYFVATCAQNGDGGTRVHWWKINHQASTLLTSPATQPTGTCYDIKWSPDSQYLAVAHVTSPYVTIYQRTDNTLTKLADPATLPPGVGRGIAWHPSENWLIVGHNFSGTGPYNVASKYTITTANPWDATPTFTHSGYITSSTNMSGWYPDFHPSGRWLILGQGNGTCHLYRQANGTFTFIRKQSMGNGTIHRWSPDGHVVASVSFDPLASIYEFDHDAETWTAVAQTIGSESQIQDVRWHPSGRYLGVARFAANPDGYSIYERDSNNVLTEVVFDQTEAFSSHQPYGLAFHPEGGSLWVAFRTNASLRTGYGWFQSKAQMPTEGIPWIGWSPRLTQG